MAVLSTKDAQGRAFLPETLVNDMVSKVGGHSSIAKLAKQVPVPFNGSREFTFSFDGDIDIVAENGEKKHGGASISPVTIIPIKFEYGMRVSNEFMYAAEDQQLPVLQAFAEGFAKRVGAGLDIAAFHGINPSTNAPSTVIGNNCLDKMVTNTVNYDSTAPDANIEDAIAMIEAAGNTEREVTGIAISTTMRSDLAKMTKAAGEKMYPDFAFGGQPQQLGSNMLDINKTVARGGVDEAIVGDFENMLKWGYSKQIPVEIIEYGDPDNTGADLKGHNQVYIRGEVFLGWGIFDADSFARVVNQ